MTVYLGQKGVTIPKSDISLQELCRIKNELTVKPNVSHMIGTSTPFPVFRESNKKLYVPRFKYKSKP